MSANVFRLVAGATTNLTKVREVGANFAGLYVLNTTASILYVKLYSSNAPPVVGTTVPWMTYQVAASTDKFVNPTEPICSNAALWIATTANAVDSDATAIGSGPIIHVFYE
jgi:hypothetical protein